MNSNNFACKLNNKIMFNLSILF